MAESSEEGGRPQTDPQSRASDRSSNEDYADSDADDGETDADRLDESMVVSDGESDGSGAHSSSSGDDEDRQRNIHRRSQMLSTMTFDTSMPSSHSYLGETQSAAEGVALVAPFCREDDAVPDLPVVSLHDIVLFPGQTLPLTLTRPAAVRAITALLEDGRCLACSPVQ